MIVDDGSTDDTRSIIDHLQPGIPVRVIHTENRGRFLARRTGLEAARGESVLLLDARVLITKGLDMTAESASEGRWVWNAHCDVNIGNNLLATFWDAMPRIFWSAYYSKPRTLSYGIEDFVKYPKGTTCFLGPRSALLEAYENFSTKYQDSRDANDDTLLIEHMARSYRIWISPDFACLYQPRQRLKKFAPHAFHRGIVFFDAYFKPGNPYALAIGAFCLGSLGLLLTAIRRPWVIPASLFMASAAAAGAGRYKRLSGRHIAALALVAPIFVVCYGAGIWRGLGMALRVRMAGPDTPAAEPATEAQTTPMGTRETSNPIP